MSSIGLTAYKIYEIGDRLSDELSSVGAVKSNELLIRVSDDDFRKIDEDLFYRINPDSGATFVPSENIIEVKFDNLIIHVIKTNPQEK